MTSIYPLINEKYHATLQISQNTKMQRKNIISKISKLIDSIQKEWCSNGSSYAEKSRIDWLC